MSCNKIIQLACDKQFNLLEFQAKVISAEHKNSAQHNCKVQQLLSQMKFFRRPAIYLEFSSYFICPPNSSVQHTIFTFCRLLPKSREREKKSASLSCDSSVASSQSTQLGEQQQLKDLLSIRACFHVCCCWRGWATKQAWKMRNVSHNLNKFITTLVGRGSSRSSRMILSCLLVQEDEWNKIT